MSSPPPRANSRRILFRAALMRIVLAILGLTLVPGAAPQPSLYYAVLGGYLVTALAVQALIWEGRGDRAQRAVLMGFVDYATLTFVVHQTGSTPTLLAGFYVFISMMYALVIPRVPALLLASYGATTYAALLVAENVGWLAYAPAAPAWVSRTPPDPALDFAAALLGYLVSIGSALIVGNVAATLRAREDELEELSQRDPLTQLYNRRHLLSRLEQELARVRRGHPLAVAMIDLDGFKQVNDKRGHMYGDRLLVRVAEALRAGTRETDVIGRPGGDEFLMLLCDTRLPEAELAVARILERVRAAGASSDGAPPVTASVGLVAAVPEDDVAAMLHRADKRCYQAKRAGGDRVVATEVS